MSMLSSDPEPSSEGCAGALTPSPSDGPSESVVDGFSSAVVIGSLGGFATNGGYCQLLGTPMGKFPPKLLYATAGLITGDKTSTRFRGSLNMPI